MWLSRTINNDERQPMSSFIVWLAHLLPSCSVSSIVIWWSSCRGTVCCGVMVVFIKYTTMMNDDRGHRSSFGCHVATQHQVLVLITKGGGWAVALITYLERKRQTTSRSSFSRHVAVSDVALCHAHSFAGANDMATPCLPCWDVPCSLWAVDRCSAWWFVSMC